jgi:uncharacterized membrane protein YtjA (UPF0391 family)
MVYYALIFLFLALMGAALIFRVVSFAATEIARVFLAMAVVVSPVSVFSYFARQRRR